MRQMMTSHALRRGILILPFLVAINSVLAPLAFAGGFRLPVQQPKLPAGPGPSGGKTLSTVVPGTPAEGKHMHLDFIDFGNSNFGVEAPFDVRVRRGERGSSVKDSASSDATMYAQISLFGKHKSIFDLQSKAENLKTSMAPITRATARLKYLGDYKIDSASFGKHNYATWLTLWRDDKTFYIGAVPVSVGSYVRLLNSVNFDLVAASASVINNGGFMAGISGGTYIMIGVPGFGLGVEGILDYLWATPQWTTTVSYSKLLLNKASIRLNAIRLRVKAFVEALFWKKSKTIVSTSSLVGFNWDLKFSQSAL